MRTAVTEIPRVRTAVSDDAHESVVYRTNLVTLHCGDALAVLRDLPAESVQTCITSPPYWGLRDYGTATWEGGDPAHLHDRVAARNGRGGSGSPGKQTVNAFPSDFAAELCSCGARRIDAQLGLENTPEEYVANLVEVFREVKRILRDDGTLWLVLGDSYAAARSYQVRDSKHVDVGNYMAAIVPSGLKPKDLVGVPWRVAFALQQPYERHVVVDPAWRGWFAGLIDGEGCYSCVAIAPTTGVNESHSTRLQIRMADTEALDRVVAITGMSNVTHDQLAPSMVEANQRPAQQWKVSGEKMADLTADVYPYLTVKRKQAVVAWNLQRLKDGVVTKRGQPIPVENMEKRRLLYDLLHDLNQRRGGDIPSWCSEPDVYREPGWYLRSDVIWAKPNPMPESVTDRPTKAHEYIFLLAKAERYYYDAEAVKEPNSEDMQRRAASGHTRGPNGKLDSSRMDAATLRGEHAKLIVANGRNRRSVWTITTQPFKGAHFAVFPTKLVEPCILAGTSERGACPTCGAPWRRAVEWTKTFESGSGRSGHAIAGKQDLSAGDGNSTPDVRRGPVVSSRTTGWSATCHCPPGDPVPCVVLDPFAGSGTVGVVCTQRGRKFIGIELNPRYVDMAVQRCAKALESTEPR